MSERHPCGCPLCRLETAILHEFLDVQRLESYQSILQSHPRLRSFSALDSMLTHLRLCRDSSCSDTMLHALLQAKRVVSDGTVERILLLVFLPHMHATLRSILRRHPHLSSEDATQNLLQSLLGFIDSEKLQAREDFLGFAIARRVKRAAFEWAEREMRPLAFESVVEALGTYGTEDSFERLVQLRHFLHRAVNRGVLNGDELNLLIQFKLENGSDDDHPQANAHRQRLKRLVLKLRRLAAKNDPVHTRR